MPVDLASLIVDVPDFPKPGVGFKDITPLLATPEGLATAIDELVLAAPSSVDLVVAELAFLDPRARLAARGLTDITALVTIEAA